MRLCAVGLGVTALAFVLLGVALVLVSAMSDGLDGSRRTAHGRWHRAFLTGVVLLFGASTCWGHRR